MASCYYRLLLLTIKLYRPFLGRESKAKCLGLSSLKLKGFSLQCFFEVKSQFVALVQRWVLSTPAFCLPASALTSQHHVSIHIVWAPREALFCHFRLLLILLGSAFLNIQGTPAQCKHESKGALPLFISKIQNLLNG